MKRGKVKVNKSCVACIDLRRKVQGKGRRLVLIRHQELKGDEGLPEWIYRGLPVYVCEEHRKDFKKHNYKVHLINPTRNGK